LKTVKPLSSKKPPVPTESLDSINEWIDDSRPKVNPLVKKLDSLVRANLKNPRYAVKWGNAYYGSVGKGWLIQLAAYDVSVNIVFLNGEKLLNPPELGGETRYIKLTNLGDVQSTQLVNWVKESCSIKGWSW
jgi:hypothetical protein